VGDTGRASGSTPAALAKGALRRLAQAQLEPTPENFAKAYADESGQPPAANEARTNGPAWAALVERLARNLARGGKQWTGARRKESLQRVLDGSRSDAGRLLQRLQSLMQAWESDQPSDPAATGIEDPPLPATAAAAADLANWPPLVQSLEATVRVALGSAEPRAADLASQLAALAASISEEGAQPAHVAAVAEVCQQAGRLLGHGHRLVAQLTELCRSLTGGLAEMSEDDSWVRGQCERLEQSLQGEPSLRDLRSAAVLLADTRQRQQQVKDERRAARDALKQLIQDMLLEVGELGEHTGRFQQATAAHAEAIARADSLESLASLVKELLQDAHTVQVAVARSQEKLQADRTQALELEARVLELEGELRRLSEEVSTDLLTQVANRRGLMQAFEAESARAAREPAQLLAVGLIDIDNFKKLNDTLGHAAGDVALKNLAAAVKERLRPVDHLARFGGEEFVVLLPGTRVEEAQQALTRLQRSLTEALFLHEGREVFVTFSAGVTAWRSGEALQPALERADEALYEAKRTGKNRTCAG
jgi:diguanylate cyclase